MAACVCTCHIRGMDLLLAILAIMLVSLGFECIRRKYPTAYEKALDGKTRHACPIYVKQTGLFEWSVVDSDECVICRHGTPDAARRAASKIHLIQRTLA